jgi:hypothetical protein
MSGFLSESGKAHCIANRKLRLRDLFRRVRQAMNDECNHRDMEYGDRDHAPNNRAEEPTLP